MYIPYSIYPSVNTWVASTFLAIVKNAAVNMGAQILLSCKRAAMQEISSQSTPSQVYLCRADFPLHWDDIITSITLPSM